MMYDDGCWVMMMVIMLMIDDDDDDDSDKYGNDRWNVEYGGCKMQNGYHLEKNYMAQNN